MKCSNNVPSYIRAFSPNTIPPTVRMPRKRGARRRRIKASQCGVAPVGDGSGDFVFVSLSDGEDSGSSSSAAGDRRPGALEDGGGDTSDGEGSVSSYDGSTLPVGAGAYQSVDLLAGGRPISVHLDAEPPSPTERATFT